jgi:hypothetical protein
MPRCANPDCPNAELLPLGLQQHWVQVQEVVLQQVGERPSAGVVQHSFAAITCSKRCAVAVLTAQLPAEDAEREKVQEIFGRAREARP